MSATHVVEIFCNRCGTWERIPGSSFTRARRSLASRGWVLRKKRTGWRDLCPACKTEEV